MTVLRAAPSVLTVPAGDGYLVYDAARGRII